MIFVILSSIRRPRAGLGEKQTDCYCGIVGAIAGLSPSVEDSPLRTHEPARVATTPLCGRLWSGVEDGLSARECARL